jgi:hypothetical protein
MPPDQSDIHIEQWRASAVPPAPPSQNTRAPTRVSRIWTECVQAVVISKPPDASPITNDIYTVTGAPLVLDFRLVFLRQPIPPLETDIILTELDLRNYATKIYTTSIPSTHGVLA